MSLKVAARETVDEVDQPIDDEQPGEEEVPAPPFREILRARQRDPIRKRAPGEKSVDIGEHAENAGGLPHGVADLGPADRRTFELLLGVDLKNRRVALVSRVAPVEARMGVEDLEPAH